MKQIVLAIETKCANKRNKVCQQVEHAGTLLSLQRKMTMKRKKGILEDKKNLATFMGEKLWLPPYLQDFAQKIIE